MNTKRLRELLERAHPGPYSWTAEDHSMCSLHGKNYMENHILSVSPCKSCQEGKTEWKWGRCTTPSKVHAELIAEALNALPALLDQLEWRPIETAPRDGRKIMLWYLNGNHKPRTVMGKWLSEEDAVYTDIDGVGLEAGWYECIDNWDDYTEVSIHQGEPTHWKPLPTPPEAP